jgi:hypothetical protein
MQPLDGLLAVYTWLVIGALVAMLALIARFYQLRSGEQSHYRFFLGALALLVGGGLIQAVTNTSPAGNPIGESLLCIGGASLLGLCYLLHQLMTVKS